MSSAATQPGPLTGVRVLDLGQVLASPFAGYLLSNLGAEVIKIEPPDGEWLRQATGGGLGFSAQNGGKKMVALDLHRPDGAQVLLRLAAGADVFLEGFAPGTADAMGLGFDAVRAQRPDVVYASLSAFGAEGPYGGRPAFDHVVQAASGIMESTGFPDQPPTKVGSPYVDYSSGLLLAFAVLAGLRQRDLTDDAVQVDITMTLSILHRMTGVALSGGFIVLAGWLFDAAAGADTYNKFYALMDTTLGCVLLVGWSYAFFYHLSNGIRHLVWDTGRGFEISQANTSAWFVLVLSVVLTALFWWVRS